MKVAFRADASVTIGSGHVMRCAALAGGLRANGAEIRFLCREYSGNCCDWLEAQGFPVTRLSMPEASKAVDFPGAGNSVGLGVLLEVEIAETSAALTANGPWDWLVVDHYALDAAWELAMRSNAAKIMAIDDLANRNHECDLLLDQNLQLAPDRYAKLVSRNCTCVLGPRHALLRAEFGTARAILTPRDGCLRRVLICFGGTDGRDFTRKAIEAFLAANLPDVVAEVVVGAGYPYWDDLELHFGNLSSIKLDRNVHDMAVRMAAADIFLGAGGSITWERATLGLPGITVALADNQRTLCEALTEIGAGFHLGDANTVDRESIAETLRVASRQSTLLRAFSQRLSSLTDGEGVRRVVRLMESRTILVRPAGPDDCDLIFSWRNDVRTRRFFFDSSPIGLDEHRKWFSQSMENSERSLLIGEDGQGPIGVIRFDRHQGKVTVSVYLDPERHGEGLGSALIRQGLSWLRQQTASQTHVYAKVLPGNQASLAAFSAAGFQECFRELVAGTDASEQELPCEF